MLQKQRLITPQTFDSQDFWPIADSVLKKVKSAIPLFNGLEVLSFTSHKAKLFAKNFFKNSNLDDSGIFSYLVSLLGLI